MPQPEPDYRSLLTSPECARPIDRVVRTLQLAGAIQNWLPLVRMRKDTGIEAGGIVDVRFRDGFDVSIRQGTHDIFTLWEVFLAGSYNSLERILNGYSEPAAVIDLGAHIGLFSLRALRASPHVRVHCYEPGPENRALLQVNLAKRQDYLSRATVYDDAVGGHSGFAEYYLNRTNTGDSSLYGSGEGVRVSKVNLKEILSRCELPIALLKIDIEGAEHELIDAANPQDWERVNAVMAEVHDDPTGISTRERWLRRMFELGFVVQKREFSTVVLTR